jgi:hypothetical protein
MHDIDLARKLHGLGLVLNRPEPAIICIRCKFALQPSGASVSRHIADKHNVPACDRRELASYVDTLRLPDPNTLEGRENGSEPHPHLLVSTGAGCSHCNFYSKSVKIVQRHLASNHTDTDQEPNWLQNGVRHRLAIQSWTQIGSRGYWAVKTGPEAAVHSSKTVSSQSPRRLKRLQTIHDEERIRIQKDNKERELMDTGVYDEAFLGSWMRRTNWTSTFSGINRLLLVRLAEAPSAGGSPLVYGVFEGQRLQSKGEDERKIRAIGVAMDAFFDRCENTARNTDHAIRCWLRSNLSDRPYKAPFQLPFRASTRSRYRALWRRLLYFWFRLYRLKPTVQRTSLRYHLTKEQKLALDKVWTDPFRDTRPQSAYLESHLDEESASRPPTRCSSMTSMSSWSVESMTPLLSTRSPDHDSQQDIERLASPCMTLKPRTKRAATESVGDGTFIDLGLDDWPSIDDPDDSLQILSSRGIQFGGETSERESVLGRSHESEAGATVPERMADMIGELSFSMCCEEFIDGQSSTTMLVYFYGVLGISPDGSTFDRPRNYTPKLSAMIHSARLICLEAVLPRDPHVHIN